SPSAAPDPLPSPLLPCGRAVEQVLLGRHHQPRAQGRARKHRPGSATSSTGSDTRWSPVPSMAVNEHRARSGQAGPGTGRRPHGSVHGVGAFGSRGAAGRQGPVARGGFVFWVPRSSELLETAFFEVATDAFPGGLVVHVVQSGTPRLTPVTGGAPRGTAAQPRHQVLACPATVLPTAQ